MAVPICSMPCLENLSLVGARVSSFSKHSGEWPLFCRMLEILKCWTFSNWRKTVNKLQLRFIRLAQMLHLLNDTLSFGDIIVAYLVVHCPSSKVAVSCACNKRVATSPWFGTRDCNSLVAVPNQGDVMVIKPFCLSEFIYRNSAIISQYSPYYKSIALN